MSYELRTKMHTFRVITLGCKVNQYESEEIAQFLEENGWRRLHDSDSLRKPDLFLVNSCSVTSEAEAKTRKTVRQAVKMSARVVVFGCAAVRKPEIFRDMPGVTDVVTGEETGENRVAAVIRAIFGEKAQRDGRGLERFGERHRAYVKIQDGCRQFCTYCIVPHVRKTLCSTPPAEVLAEVRGLVSRGYREIVLTGIHLGYYGEGIRSRSDALWRPECGEKEPGVNLAVVVRRLAEENVAGEEDFRVRISSLEAEEASDELIRVMAEHPKRVCPHFHLSMQSGSDAVLRRMNRPKGNAEFLERCMAAKEVVKDVALTTDVIVGFPGETERDFLATCAAVETAGFSKVHIFRYSPREGTPAAKMTGQIPEAEKQRRWAHLAEIEAREREKFIRRLAGKEMTVLVERSCPLPEDGKMKYRLFGTSERYLSVAWVGEKDFVGKLVSVHR